MKVEKMQKVFKPLLITLESSAELSYFKTIFRMHIDNEVRQINPDLRNFAIQLFHKIGEVYNYEE